MIRDLRQLDVFVQIVQSGSMTAAARALGQGLNTVSRRLAALENQIGQPLFVRTTRRMEITDAGQRLYEHARAILAAVTRAEEELQPSQALTGRVRVAMGTANAHVGLLRRIAGLLHEHPGLALDIQISDEPVDIFSRGFDLAIHVGPMADSRLVAVRLTQVYGWLAATPDYLDRFGCPRHHRDLADHECLRFRTAGRQHIWPLVDARGRRVDAPVGGRFESNNSRVLFEAMLAGVGIGTGFLTVHESALEDGTLVPVLPGLRYGPLPINALMPASVARSRAVRAVLDLLAESLDTGTEFAHRPGSRLPGARA